MRLMRRGAWYTISAQGNTIAITRAVGVHDILGMVGNKTNDKALLRPPRRSRPCTVHPGTERHNEPHYLDYGFYWKLNLCTHVIALVRKQCIDASEAMRSSTGGPQAPRPIFIIMGTRHSLSTTLLSTAALKAGSYTWTGGSGLFM